MKSFIGTYECKMDDKSRLKLPSLLIKQMEDFRDEAFVIKRSVFQNCLEVYPMRYWDNLMIKINGLNRFVKKMPILSDCLLQELKWLILMAQVVYKSLKIW